MLGIEATIAWLEKIYGSFAPTHGVAAQELAAAQARLGLTFPDALCTYYLRTGAHAELHSAHNRLVDLGRIDFVGDHLVFYEENQGVVVWGVARDRLGDPDPPVEQAPCVEGETWTFYPEFSSVSEFAGTQGAWQAVQGGLVFVGGKQLLPSGTVSAGVRERLGAPEVHSRGIDAWIVPGGVFVLAGSSYAGLAARSEHEFRAASEHVGIGLGGWDYTTMDDALSDQDEADEVD